MSHEKTEQNRLLNEGLFEKLQVDGRLHRDAADAVSCFTRAKMWEDGFYNDLMRNCPPVGHELRCLGYAAYVVIEWVSFQPYRMLRLSLPQDRFVDITQYEETKERKFYHMPTRERPIRLEMSRQGMSRFQGEADSRGIEISTTADFELAFTMLRRFRRASARWDCMPMSSGSFYGKDKKAVDEARQISFMLYRKAVEYGKWEDKHK